MALDDFQNRLKTVGVLYVDVYPYRRNPAGGEIEFLLVRRNDNVELPGTWQALSGKIKEGETIRAAIWRQPEHKLGVAALLAFKVDFINTFYDDYYDTVMMVPQAACELPYEATVALSDLHTEFQWVPADKVADFFVWPNQVKVAGMVAAMVAQGVGTFHLLPRP